MYAIDSFKIASSKLFLESKIASCKLFLESKRDGINL